MTFEKVWETIFSTQDWGRYASEDLVRFVARNFYRAPNRADVKILEIGCGPGANLWFCAREGFSVYGVDGSATAIAKATARLDAECPGWQGMLSVGDIVKLGFENGVFDAVLDIEAVYCNSFEDSVRIYNEAHRVLKKDGKLYVRTFADGCWGDGTGEKVAPDAYRCSEGPLAGKGYSRFTTLEQIAKLLPNFELENIELLTRSCEDRQQNVKEWMITARKA